MRVLLLALVLLVSASANATPNDAQLKEMRSSVKPIVSINQQGSASVVVIAKGRALTAAHVAKVPVPLEIIDGDRRVPVKVVKVDEEHDVALLEADVDCPCAVLANKVEVDKPAFIVGFPLGLKIGFVQFLSEGRVQSIDQTDKSVWTDAPMVPGNSGGGVFQVQNGKVVLIGTARGILGGSLIVFPHLSNSANVSWALELLK